MNSAYETRATAMVALWVGERPLTHSHVPRPYAIPI